MKKVIAVFSILLILVCSLAGCKKPEPASALYGSWEAEIDLSAYLKERIINDNNTLKETLVLSSYPAKVVFTFKEDGSVTRTIEGAFDEATLGTLQSELKAGYTAYYTDYLKKNDLDMTISAFEKATGISLDRKAEQVADKTYLDGLVDEIEFNGTFTADENFIRLGGYVEAVQKTVHTYTLGQEGLVLSTAVEASDFEKAFYPLTLTAVKE